jgi:hypothetical protein
MNQGPKGDCLMKKTEGRKSRDTVPLRCVFLHNIANFLWQSLGKLGKFAH